MAGLDNRVPAKVTIRNALHVKLLATPTKGFTPSPKSNSEASEAPSPSNRSLPAPISPDTDPEHHRSTLAIIPEISHEQHYFLPDEVDVRATPVKLEPLIYPEEAFLRKIGGRVRMRVFINESGEIDSVDVVAADPPNVFEDAALTAILATHFAPAIKEGKRVKSQKLIEVNFDPNEKLDQEVIVSPAPNNPANTTAP